MKLSFKPTNPKTELQRALATRHALKLEVERHAKFGVELEAEILRLTREAKVSPEELKVMTEASVNTSQAVADARKEAARKAVETRKARLAGKTVAGPDIGAAAPVANPVVPQASLPLGPAGVVQPKKK